MKEQITEFFSWTTHSFATNAKKSDTLPMVAANLQL